MLPTAADVGNGKQKVIVLVGGGHAHAQVIKEYNRANISSEEAKVILIDPLKSASYSGMIPGCVAEQYTQEQTQIHLEPLAEWAGIEYFNASVVDIDPIAKNLYLSASPYTCDKDSLPVGIPHSLHYDVASFDIGCRTAGTETPGVGEFAIPTRPIHLLVKKIDAKVTTASGSRPVRLVICAAGAAGIELAMTAAVKVKKAGKEVTTVLIDANKELLPDDPPCVRTMMSKVLAERDITVIHERRVVELSASDVLLHNGEAVPYDIAIWPTGAASHAVAAKIAAAGIATSSEGWIRVSNTLQSITHPSIFAAGDCCTFDSLSKQPGKAGVYAVRTGPILIKNLLGSLRAEPLVEYTPQPEFLRLFNCGDGYGFGIRHTIPLYGPFVWVWKDFIDQWFMNLFKKENLPDLSVVRGADTQQFDAALQQVLVKAPAEPAEAAEMLLRTDADLDIVKDIINRMNADVAYRLAVVEVCHKTLSPK